MSIEVGSKVQGKVTGITNFGAFVELPNGSTGLVHISEVADNYVKDINDHLKVGEMVEVKVMNIEADGKIGLSIRKAKPQAERPEDQNVLNVHATIIIVQMIVAKIVNRKKTLNKKWRVS